MPKRERKFTETQTKDVFAVKNEDEIVYSEDLRKALAKRVRFSEHAIRSVIWFNGDENIVSSSMETCVKVWDLWNRQLLHSFDDVQGPVSQVRLTRDAKQLIGSGMDSRLYFWDMSTGQPIWIRETDFGLLCCDLSPDNNLIATGSDMDATVLFWDRRTGDVVHGLTAPFKGSVTSTVISPDGVHMAACDMEGPARLYDIRARRVVLSVKNESVFLTGLAFSKDSRLLLTSALNSRLNLYDIATGGYRMEPNTTSLNTVRPACLTCCDFSTLQSQLFCAGTADGRLLIWDSDQRKNLFDLTAHGTRITDCVFSPTGKFLITACEDGTARLWSIRDLKSTKLYRRARAKNPPVMTCTVCEANFPFIESPNESSAAEDRCIFCRIEGKFPP